MLQALRLADLRRGFCAPNPAVGALVTKNGEILGEGTHLYAGSPHAEAEALRNLDGRAEGATLIVTLEPCNHHGRTPPCTELLRQRGVREVIYGFKDPNSQVTGGGEKQLKSWGIEARLEAHPEVEAFYESYTHWLATGLPFVTSKIAVSADGKIAGPGGKRIKISGDELDSFTHHHRRRCDAILTSSRTLLADNPRLNARVSGEDIAKKVYVLDRQLMVPPGLQIFESAEKIVIFCEENASAQKRKALEHCGAEVRECATVLQGSFLEKVVKSIGRDGVHDLWVEAGAQCFEALWMEALVDRAFIYKCDRVLGEKAFPSFSFKLLEAQPLHWQRMGKDFLAEVRP